MESVKISDIKIGERFRKKPGDIPALAESIKAIGLLHPVVVDSDLNLMAGLRRLRAAEFLGWTEINVNFADPNLLLQIEHDENELRENFTVSERVAIADAIEQEMVKQKTHADLPPSHRCGKRMDEAAKKAGLGNKQTYHDARKVVAEAEPEIVEAMDDGTLSISDAARAASHSPEDQRAALDEVESGNARTASEAMERRKARGDRTGKPWPESILPAIEESIALNKLRQELSSIINRSRILSQGHMKTHIEWEPIIANLEKSKKDMVDGFPAYICPYCSGKGQRCKPCKGSGWVTHKIYIKSPAVVG